MYTKYRLSPIYSFDTVAISCIDILLSQSEYKIKAYLYAMRDERLCSYFPFTRNSQWIILFFKREGLIFQNEAIQLWIFLLLRSCVWKIDTRAQSTYCALFHPDTVRCFELILPNKKKLKIEKKARIRLNSISFDIAFCTARRKILRTFKRGGQIENVKKRQKKCKKKKI